MNQAHPYLSTWRPGSCPICWRNGSPHHSWQEQKEAYVHWQRIEHETKRKCWTNCQEASLVWSDDFWSPCLWKDGIFCWFASPEYPPKSVSPVLPSVITKSRSTNAKNDLNLLNKTSKGITVEGKTNAKWLESLLLTYKWKCLRRWLSEKMPKIEESIFEFALTLY